MRLEGFAVSMFANFLRVFAPRPLPAAPPPKAVASPRFDACLAEVLKHEGGYVDHPDDPGGATNMGITHATLAAWRGKAVTKADVKALQRAEVASIYRSRYWLPVNGDALPPGVDLVLFDFAVNSGPARAVKTLQRVLGVTQDGAIGPVTMAALKASPGPVTVIMDMSDARMAFLKSLKTWPTFGRGWTRRVDEVEAAAMAVV